MTHRRRNALILIVLLALVGAAVLRAVHTRKVQQSALQAQQQQQQSEAAITLAGSDLIAVQAQDLPRELAISGEFKAANSAFVKARVAGDLQGLSVREGERVQAGQVLARVDATEYQARLRQAQQQADAARAQVDIAQRTDDNNRALVQQGFISKTALDTSTATLASAQANYHAAQAGADLATKALNDTVLRAPLSGQVSQRLVQPGERVAVDTRVLEIVDLSRIELEATLSPADSLSVQIGQSARLTVEGAAQPLQAKVVRVNPSAVGGSRTVLAYLAVQGGSNLRQGLFAQGTLQLGRDHAIAVPLSAVRTDQPQPYVMLVQQGQIHYQTVQLGARSVVGEQTLVRVDGLSAGQTVLGVGAGLLREGTRVQLPAAGK